MCFDHLLDHGFCNKQLFLRGSCKIQKKKWKSFLKYQKFSETQIQVNANPISYFQLRHEEKLEWSIWRYEACRENFRKGLISSLKINTESCMEFTISESGVLLIQIPDFGKENCECKFLCNIFWAVFQHLSLMREETLKLSQAFR